MIDISMRDFMIPQLVSLLKNYYALYLKLHNYHWNVEGPHFKALHELFEMHYRDATESIDAVGEHIRALGHKVPSIVDIYSTADIRPALENASASQMLEDLMASYAMLQMQLHEIRKIAEDMSDDVMIDFSVEQMAHHRKTAWMLKSSL